MSTASVLDFPMQPVGSGAPELNGPDAFGTVPELPNLHERWTVRRKATAIDAVRGGWIPIEDVCVLYCISVDEFLAWERDLDVTASPVCARPGTRFIAIPTSVPGRKRKR